MADDVDAAEERRSDAAPRGGGADGGKGAVGAVQSGAEAGERDGQRFDGDGGAESGDAVGFGSGGGGSDASAGESASEGGRGGEGGSGSGGGTAGVGVAVVGTPVRREVRELAASTGNSRRSVTELVRVFEGSGECQGGTLGTPLQSDEGGHGLEGSPVAGRNVVGQNLGAEIAFLQADNEQLSSRVHASLLERRALQTQLDESIEQQRSLRADLGRLNMLLEDSQAQLASAQAEAAASSDAAMQLMTLDGDSEPPVAQSGAPAPPAATPSIPAQTERVDEDEVAANRATIQQLRYEHDQVLAQLAEATTERDRGAATIEELKALYERCVHDRDSAQTSAAERARQLAQLETEHAELEKAHSALDGQLSTARSELADCRAAAVADVEQAEQAAEKRVREELAAEVKRYADDAEEAAEFAASSEEECRRLRQELLDTEAKADDDGVAVEAELKETSDAHIRKMETSWKLERQQLLDQIDCLKQEVTELESRAQGGEAEVHAAQSVAVDASAAREAAEADMHRAKANAGASKAEADALRREVASARQDVRRLTEELEQAAHAVQAASDQRSAAVEDAKKAMREHFKRVKAQWVVETKKDSEALRAQLERDKAQSIATAVAESERKLNTATAKAARQAAAAHEAMLSAAQRERENAVVAGEQAFAAEKKSLVVKHESAIRQHKSGRGLSVLDAFVRRRQESSLAWGFRRWRMSTTEHSSLVIAARWFAAELFACERTVRVARNVLQAWRSATMVSWRRGYKDGPVRDASAISMWRSTGCATIGGTHAFRASRARPPYPSLLRATQVVSPLHLSVAVCGSTGAVAPWLKRRVARAARHPLRAASTSDDEAVIRWSTGSADDDRKLDVVAASWSSLQRRASTPRVGAQRESAHAALPQHMTIVISRRKLNACMLLESIIGQQHLRDLRCGWDCLCPPRTTTASADTAVLMDEITFLNEELKRAKGQVWSLKRQILADTSA